MDVAPPASTSTMHHAQLYSDGNTVLDCSKATLQQATTSAAMSTTTSTTSSSVTDVNSDTKKRKKISYAIEDLLKKDDDS